MASDVLLRIRNSWNAMKPPGYNRHPGRDVPS
jgi:hypothetical protein